jgi:hypothetical protein
VKGSVGGLKWWKREASRLDRVAKGNVLPGGRKALPEARGPEARLREIGGIKCRPGRPGVLALYRGVSGMELHRLAIAVGTEQSRAHIRWMIRRDMSEVQKIETKVTTEKIESAEQNQTVDDPIAFELEVNELLNGENVDVRITEVNGVKEIFISWMKRS